ncbi:hypothetical protein [Kamptonema sp. PCC 6506]|uniref:hypothetical protein n=1 Tax=Kamptonema sp. PCC 6506 TaxID=272129 RepID=UPI0001DAD57F|nr:hypothetical protein [Kamptonema sp. PCC 6506]CBN53591.1 hypothetical protein OSCI_10058 [Kamptonema sp. PCC 6506]
MEQYEVDYQKNSLRGKDAKEVKENTGLNPDTLLEKVDEWCEKESKELHVPYQYKNALVEREIDYRHSKENDLYWEENELQWAKDLVQRFQEDKSIIYDRTVKLSGKSNRSSQCQTSR